MGLGRDQTRDPWICSQTRTFVSADKYFSRMYEPVPDPEILPNRTMARLNSSVMVLDHLDNR